MLGSEHADLEDTIQESLVAFVQALPSYRFDGDITHYAVRIAFRATLYTKKRSIKWRDRFRSPAPSRIRPICFFVAFRGSHVDPAT